MACQRGAGTPTGSVPQRVLPQHRWHHAPVNHRPAAPYYDSRPAYLPPSHRFRCWCCWCCCPRPSVVSCHCVPAGDHQRGFPPLPLPHVPLLQQQGHRQAGGHALGGPLRQARQVCVPPRGDDDPHRLPPATCWLLPTVACRSPGASHAFYRRRHLCPRPPPRPPLCRLQPSTSPRTRSPSPTSARSSRRYRTPNSARTAGSSSRGTTSP